MLTFQVQHSSLQFSFHSDTQSKQPQTNRARSKMPKATPKVHPMMTKIPRKRETDIIVKSDDKYNWYSEDYRAKRGFPKPSAPPAGNMDNYKVQVKNFEENLKDLKLTISRFEEKLKQKNTENSALTREIATQIQLRQTADDERDFLKVKMASLEKELEKVKKEQAAERNTFAVVLQKTKSEFEQVVCERDMFSQNTKDIAKLKASLQESEHQKQQLLQKMETLRRFHQEELKMIKKETVALVEISENLEVKMTLKDENEKALLQEIAQLKFEIQQMKEQETCQNMEWEKEKTTLKKSIIDLKEVIQDKHVQLQGTTEQLELKVRETSALEDKAADLEESMDQMKAEEAQRSTAWMEKMAALKEKLWREQEENTELVKKVRVLEQMRAEETQRTTAQEEDMDVLRQELREEREENARLLEKVQLLEQKKKNKKWYRRLFSRST